jgi:hypothetical protein
MMYFKVLECRAVMMMSFKLHKYNDVFKVFKGRAATAFKIGYRCLQQRLYYENSAYYSTCVGIWMWLKRAKFYTIGNGCGPHALNSILLVFHRLFP